MHREGKKGKKLHEEKRWEEKKHEDKERWEEEEGR